MTTSKSYDYLNRLTQISSQPGASGLPPMAFNYSYNPANQRTQDKLAEGSYWVYQYDSLGQVISGHKYFYDNTPVPGQQFDYTFDTIRPRYDGTTTTNCFVAYDAMETLLSWPMPPTERPRGITNTAPSGKSSAKPARWRRPIPFGSRRSIRMMSRTCFTMVTAFIKHQQEPG